LVNGLAELLGVVSIDGTSINENGMTRNRILWVNHVFLPPGARVEWIFKGAPKGAHARFITRSVDTGPAGENDPARPLAAILATEHAPKSKLSLADSPLPLPPTTLVWLGDVKPIRVLPKASGISHGSQSLEHKRHRASNR
jgi:hypothetical protein